MAGRSVSRLLFSPLFFVLAVFLAFTAPGWAQNAQIAGTVLDPSNAAIPNASVLLIETATQVKRESRSNSDGRYVAPSLPPGAYQITIQAQGFATQVVQNVKLNVAGKVSMDFVLHPGSVSESVTVDGSGISLNTTDASVSTSSTVSSSKIFLSTDAAFNPS